MRSRFLVCAAAVALFAAFAAPASVQAVDLIGYLPYYRMGSASYVNNTLPDQLEMLDEIRYFGLTASNTGAIVPLGGSGSMATHTNNINTIKAKIAALPESQRPRLNITLGGAGEAASYSTIAASSSLRATFSQNIAALLDSTGAVSVDIDWEHPAISEQNNHSLLMQRIKQELGPTRAAWATMTPERFMPAGAFQGANAIDGVSLMTYDLNWWGNDPGNPNTGEHSLPEYVEDSLDAWTMPVGSPNQRPWVFPSWGKGIDPALLGVGLPFYGKDISTATAYTYAELATSWTTSDQNYYTKNGATVWIPGPDLVEQRVEFAHERGLHNIIVWEIAQDLPPTHELSLLRRAYETNQSFLPVPGDYDGNGSVGASDYNLWKSTYGSTEGDMRADGNQDGIVDAVDYTLWRNLMTPSAGTGGMSLVVPEPLGVVYVVTAFTMLLLSRRVK
jgi:GH18 family chitinase